MQRTHLALYLLTSLLLAAILSGCAFGGRRLKANDQPAPAQQKELTPSSTVTVRSGPSTSEGTGTNGGEAEPTTAPGFDAQGQILSDQIDALDTANQSADALEDLP